MSNVLYRQGDVLIERLPDNAEPKLGKVRPDGVIAHGEVTGHMHRVATLDTATLFDGLDGVMYLRVVDTAIVSHDEHAAVTLPAGIYKVYQQREYTPQAIRRVID